MLDERVARAGLDLANRLFVVSEGREIEGPALEEDAMRGRKLEEALLTLGVVPPHEPHLIDALDLRTAHPARLDRVLDRRTHLGADCSKRLADVCLIVPAENRAGGREGRSLARQ